MIFKRHQLSLVSSPPASVLVLGVKFSLGTERWTSEPASPTCWWCPRTRAGRSRWMQGWGRSLARRRFCTAEERRCQSWNLWQITSHCHRSHRLWDNITSGDNHDIRLKFWVKCTVLRFSDEFSADVTVKIFKSVVCYFVCQIRSYGFELILIRCTLIIEYRYQNLINNLFRKVFVIIVVNKKN